MRILAVLSLSLVLVCNGVAFAQAPSAPQRVQGPCTLSWEPKSPTPKERRPLSVLTEAYLHSWETFQATAKELLDAAKTQPKSVSVQPPLTCNGSVYDYRTHTIQLLWIDDDSFGTQTLFSAFVTEPSPSSYTAIMPGLVIVQQVFLGRQSSDTLASLYTSTEQRNPLVDQLPDVVAAMTNPLLALASQAGGQMQRVATAAAAAKPPAATLWATVSAVRLPHRRATVDFKGVAIVQPTSLRSQIAALTEKLKTNDSRYSKCGRDLADDLKTAFDAKAELCAAATLPTAKQTCMAQLDADFTAKYDARLKACSAAPPKEDVEAMQTVDGEFRKFVSGLKPGEVTASIALKNTPLERVSFGLASGVVAAGRLTRTRVKLNDAGNVVSDPLGRQISMVTINSSFRPFDPVSIGLTKAEAFRWFGGAVVTPSFGFAGGLSVLVARGVGINLGVAAIAVPALREGDELNKAPASTSDPFGLGWARVVFVGMSYNFKS